MGGSKLKEENSASVAVVERRSAENEHEHEHCPCPSTSDDDDPGLRPSDLYGKFTWKIESFSQISKRELRSNVFEVGGYKWYILVYPQGCDVCNHLSLFLCVADYDKLLPGWSHFAQFTIAVVNKDPKKSKYSEHDWGWKKFMEVSKVLDGFTMADTLVIKAQVQVIRENPHRPFRCLDWQYRRELVRVYITNVEAICRRFVEEKRENLGKLIEDTVKWSSFCTFWLAVDEDEQRRMSREKTDVILKQVVKRFFNEKEVTSTLVMDALYSGYKALECQSANNKGKNKSMELEDISSPVICVEKDAFVLADDVLSLLERAATEPLPPLKDDKGPQNRTKDGSSGDDFGRDSVDCDEKCLTELGRRTVEMFVLAYLYSNHVEMAYQRDVSIKMQEELIREEEAASHAEIELRAKREAADKEKRSKKKQAKQRRSIRKEKDRVRNDKGDMIVQHQHQHEVLSGIRNLGISSSKDSSSPVLEILGTPDEGDLSGLYKTDNVVGIIGPETEDGDVSRVDWDRDSSEMQQDMEASFSGAVSVTAQSVRIGRKQRPALDDSSSTCSTDSLASVAMNGSYKGSSSFSSKCESLSTRGKNKSNSERYDTNSSTRAAASAVVIYALEANSNFSKSSSNEEAAILSLKQHVRCLEQRIVEKDEEISLLKKQLSSYQHQIDCDKPRKQKDMTANHCYTRNSGLSSSKLVDDDKHRSSCMQADDSTLKLSSSSSPGELQVKCSLPKNLPTESSNLDGSDLTPNKNISFTHSVSFKHNPQKSSSPRSHSREFDHHAQSAATPPLQIESDEMLRPSSAPLIPAGARSNIPAALTPSVPLLARSVSAAGRLDGSIDPMTLSSSSLSRSPSVSPSYRNAAAGKMKGTSSSGHFPLVVSSAAQTGICVTLNPPSSLCTSSPSNLYKVRVSCPESLGRIREDTSPSSTCISSHVYTPQASMLNGFAKDQSPICGVEQSASSMGFTFGTIMPELLHRNPTQELQDVDVAISGVEDILYKQDCHQQQHRFLEQCTHQQPRKLQNLQTNQFHSQQDNLGIRFPQSCPDDLSRQGSLENNNSRNVIRRAGAVMAEDFPHLDIIDYLLDEEQNRGKVALSTKLQNPGEQILNGQFYLPGFHGPKIDLHNGGRFDRYIPEEDGTLQMACSSDWCGTGLSESMQMLPAYAHSSPTQYFDQYSGPLEEVPPHNWSMYSADMPGKSVISNGHGPIASPMGNSIQGHHYSAGHCSNFTLGPNDYAFY